MNPIRQTVTGTGTSPLINLDYNANPFNVGVACVVTGTATFSVQHTYDDITSSTFSTATATWFTATAFSGKSANTDGAYTTPCTALQLRLTAATGSPTVAITVIQANEAP